MTGHGDVTELLLGLDQDRDRAVDRLFPKVYDELRAVATARLRAERAGHTLSATALVHEAYLKLVDQRRVDWKNRAHFFAIAARAMRRILLDHATARNAEKRGGGAALVTLGEESASRESNLDEVLALDQAMGRLAALDPRQERVVELRFFGGLNLEEIAEVLGVSLASVNRDWRMARAFLTAELQG
jgi:RNA polymerase sigma factor (TIGR02999 family)